MEAIVDFIDDAFFSSLRLIRRNKMESDSKRIFIFIYLLILFIYFFILIYSIRHKQQFLTLNFLFKKEIMKNI